MRIPHDGDCCFSAAATHRILTASIAICMTARALCAAGLPATWSLFAPVDTSALASLRTIPASLPGENGPVKPRPIVLKNNMLDLAPLAGGIKEKRCAILMADMRSPRTTVLKVGTGADWWVDWYVNGKRVFTLPLNGNATTRYSITNYQFGLPLDSGDNVIAIVARSGSKGFALWAGADEALDQALAAQAREDEKLCKPLIDAANRRIADIRMGTLTIKTTPGAAVTVRQVRNEFWFGTCIGSRLLDTTADARHYRDTLKTYFNAAVHENALKWSATERNGPGTPDYRGADEVLGWCEANGISMRGHCVFWGVGGEDGGAVQPWVKALGDSALRATMERRAKSVAARYKDRIHEYDLNNEMLHGDYYEERLGPGIVADMARWMKETDPGAMLFVNDYDVTGQGAAQDYARQIRGFLKRGIPFGGVGTQCHFVSDIDIPAVQRDLDTLAQLGLPIRITEFDFMTGDEERKAALLDRLYRICFAHPAVTGILMWGFWEGRHWRPQAALWKKDWTPAPAGRAYANLVNREWRTSVSGKADANGVFTTRAFYGDYEVQCGATRRTFPFPAAEKAKTVEVR